MVSKIIDWLIVGIIAGTLAGRLATLSKRGYGPWTNIGIGMIGALVGGILFGVLGIDLGLGEIRITLEDLLAAFIGSLVLIGVLCLKGKKRKKEGIHILD